MTKLKKTRKELLDLKERIGVAKRGKDLLEDRIGALNQRITQQAHQVYSTRLELREELLKAYKQLGKSISMDRHGVIEQAISPPNILNAQVEIDNVMGVKVSQIRIIKDNEKVVLSDRPALKEVRKEFTNVLEMMAELSSQENYLEKISEELKRTRQRFNSLDQQVIPRIEENINEIELHLEERAQEEQYKQKQWR